MDTPQLLRISEAGGRLGVSRSTVYELMSSGELRFVKLGRARRIPVSELAALVVRRLSDADPTSLADLTETEPTDLRSANS